MRRRALTNKCSKSKLSKSTLLKRRKSRKRSLRLRSVVDLLLRRSPRAPLRPKRLALRAPLAAKRRKLALANQRPKRSVVDLLERPLPLQNPAASPAARRYSRKRKKWSLYRLSSLLKSKRLQRN